MEKSRELALTQMKKCVQSLGSSTQFGDPTLMRFLVARSMDPEKAAKMFVQWQTWRADMVPNGSISETKIRDELEAEKVYLQGLSKRGGRPVLLVKACKHFPSKDQHQFKNGPKLVVTTWLACLVLVLEHMHNRVQLVCRHVSYLVYHITRNWRIRDISARQNHCKCLIFVPILRSSTVECFCFPSFGGREIGDSLHGYSDLSWNTRHLYSICLFFNLLSLAYYPERLAKLFILSMPWFFVSVWRMISRFLEKATLEKIVIVSNEDEKRDFMKEVGEEVLPEEYGDRAKLVPIQDVVLTPLDD